MISVPMSEEFITYNYNNEVVAYYSDIKKICETKLEYHSMIFIISGNLSLQFENKEIVFEKGQTIFIKRNHQLNKTKIPLRGEPFKAIVIHFKTEELKSVYNFLQTKIDHKAHVNNIKFFHVLPNNVAFTSLFHSLEYYVNANELLSPELMRLKLQEAVLALIGTKENLETILFDFSDQWKINLEDFMNKHYTDDLSISEFAYYTGRSLTTFKKDFAKTFGSSPAKWIQTQRLEKAKELMLQQNKRPSEVYLSVGFKNRSHFTTAFKKEFGISPGLFCEENVFSEK